jgi:hypothetical protein
MHSSRDLRPRAGARFSRRSAARVLVTAAQHGGFAHGDGRSYKKLMRSHIVLASWQEHASDHSLVIFLQHSEGL